MTSGSVVAVDRFRCRTGKLAAEVSHSAMVGWTDPGLVERRPVWSIPDDGGGGGGGAGVVQTGGRTRWRTFRQTFEQDWMLLVPPIMMMMTCYH